MTKDDNGDFSDELFEPFDLENLPQEQSTTPEPVYEEVPVEAYREPQPVSTQPTVRCPSCGSLNPAHNRHCEECGARLTRDPLPVAPPPMVRATPGGRALMVLLGVLAIVVIVALGMQIFGGDDGTAVAQSTTTTTSTTTANTVTQTVLEPASVEVSSFHANLPGENLIDGNPNTYWNDNSLRGVGATIVFTFAQPVAITEMELQNVVEDEPFKRNYRIKDFQVTVDDLQIELPFTMPDSNEPFRAPVATLQTRRLTITVLDTYPGEPVGTLPSFTELALSEVRFFGTVSQ